MNITCEIARDLEELSAARTLRPDTEKALNEHYAQCEECAARAKKLQSEKKQTESTEQTNSGAGKIYQFPKNDPRIKAEFCAPEDVLIEKSMERLSKRLKIQKTIRTVCTAAAVLSIIAAVFDAVRNIRDVCE